MLRPDVSFILKKLREDRGLSQKEVGEALGNKSGSWVSNIERSIRGISAEDLGLLADFYGISPSNFFDSPLDSKYTGEIITKGLAAKQITIDELSKKLNIDFFILSDALAGKETLNPSQLKEIGAILDIYEPPFINYKEYIINSILTLANNLELDDNDLASLKSFLQNRAKTE